MTPRPNLNELSKIVFEDNKKKGFHDEEHSDEHYLMLVITELSEAVEADRKGRRTDPLDLAWAQSTADEGHLTKEHFPQTIKDTVEDELCDAVIRLLDFAGMRGICLGNNEFSHMAWHKFSFAENVFNIIEVMYLFVNDQRYNRVECLMEEIEALCKHLNIDLWLHVDLKLRYNRTREYKHGKNY